MNPNKIGKFIFRLRTENHLSQYQLADKIPISRQAVSKWERGQTIPDSSTLIQLSKIFNVTINELLNGERKENNSIKELETTTLSIVDEHNKKTKIIKILLHTLIPIILVLIILFLGYYFINSYNSIKVYTINGQGKVFDLYEGIMILTKEKSYVKLGKIQNSNNYSINSIQLYIKDKEKEILIIEDKDIDKTIIGLHGYNEKITHYNEKELLNNSYLLIYYNDSQIDKIKLEYHRDFTNNHYLFTKKKKDTTNIIEKNYKDNNDYVKETINILKEKGDKNNNTISMTIPNDTEYSIIYFENINELVFKKEENTVWYILLDSNYYYCMDDSLSKEKCQENIKNILTKYVLDIG